MKDDLDIVDQDKFHALLNGRDSESGENERLPSMSLAERTSFFIINAVLMSVCYCIKEAE